MIGSVFVAITISDKLDWAEGVSDIVLRNGLLGHRAF